MCLYTSCILFIHSYLIAISAKFVRLKIILGHIYSPPKTLIFPRTIEGAANRGWKTFIIVFKVVNFLNMFKRWKHINVFVFFCFFISSVLKQLILESVLMKNWNKKIVLTFSWNKSCLIFDITITHCKNVTETEFVWSFKGLLSLLLNHITIIQKNTILYKTSLQFFTF